MATFIFLKDILVPLYHSLGEDTVPDSVPPTYTDAIQAAVERVARLYDFDWTRGQFTVPLTNGSSTAPLDSAIAVDGKMDIRVVNPGSQNDDVFVEVPLEDFDQYAEGDFRYYLAYSPSTTGMQATLVTTEPHVDSVQLTAALAAPTISNVVGVSFPSAKVMSDFALVLVRRAEDKDADTSVEEAIAMQGLSEIVAYEQRNNPKGRAKNRYEQTGHHTGEVVGPLRVFWGE